MQKEVITLDADPEQNRNICSLLDKLDFTPVPVASVAQFHRHASRHGCRAVIINLASISINNRILKDMKRAYPGIHIVTLSNRPFHPELEDAFRVSIYASLALPADPHDLGYLLGSVFE